MQKCDLGTFVWGSCCWSHTTLLTPRLLFPNWLFPIGTDHYISWVYQGSSVHLKHSRTEQLFLILSWWMWGQVCKRSVFLVFTKSRILLRSNRSFKRCRLGFIWKDDWRMYLHFQTSWWIPTQSLLTYLCVRYQILYNNGRFYIRGNSVVKLW